MPRSQAEDTSEKLTEEFVRCWELERCAERAQHVLTRLRPSLSWALWRRFKVTYCIYWIPLIFGCRALCPNSHSPRLSLVCNGLIAPVLLNALLTFLSHPEVPLQWGVVAAVGLTVTSLIATWTIQRARWRDRHVLVNFRSSLLGLLCAGLHSLHQHQH